MMYYNLYYITQITQNKYSWTGLYMGSTTQHADE